MSTEPNPFTPPSASLEDGELPVEYVGFWLRVVAAIIDTVIMMVILTPLTFVVYGTTGFSGELFLGPADLLINYVLPAVLIIGLWVKYSATPGKMILGMRIVDADTGERIGAGRAIVRYIGYFVSMIVLCLGYFWVGWDRRKQGWHDKMAGTVVIKGGRPN